MGGSIKNQIVAPHEHIDRPGRLLLHVNVHELSQFTECLVALVAKSHGIADNRPALLDLNDLHVQRGNLGHQLVHFRRRIENPLVGHLSQILHAGVETPQLRSQSISTQNGQVPDGRVLGLIQHIVNAVEKLGHRRADVAVRQLANRRLQLEIHLFLHIPIA